MWGVGSVAVDDMHHHVHVVKHVATIVGSTVDESVILVPSAT
jgi:hypothetical protein